MKILVPCDFSEASNNAAVYAAKFAKELDAEITLFHVVHFQHPPMVQVTGHIEHQIEEVRLSKAAQEASHLADELKSTVKEVRVSFKVLVGSPIEEAIQVYVQLNKIDLIIMGTKGVTGLQKILFGSKAVAVINKSSVPVITVPETSTFDKVKLIAYASDMHKIRSEIQSIIPFAKLLDASIGIVHVLPLDSKQQIDSAHIEKELIEALKYEKISVHITHHDNTIEGINHFVLDAKANILAMHTHEVGFLENIFKTSYSREQAFHPIVPLLCFKN